MANPLLDVPKYGQSIWYDNIRRGLITSGDLMRMVNEDGLLGVTSNPAIFEKAVAGSTDYDQALKALVLSGVGDAQTIYERLAIEDIQLACDVLHPVYLRTQGRDGYISLEVSPHLAHDTQATLDEAHRLHKAVCRDNVMIKVPATPAGVPAIRQLISEGINVNVTLLFAVDAYEAVARAYVDGIEALVARGGDPSKVASVASFFVSRIDTLVDARLEKRLDATTEGDLRTKLKGLVGKVAIANAKIAYAAAAKIYGEPRWQAVAAKGARTQRLLWASTSTKNPKYPKTLYVDELMGPDTVNTVPADTFAAFRESGKPQASLTQGADAARATMQALGEVGISMKEVTDTLLADAVRLFCEPFDKLLAAVEKKRQSILGGELSQQAAKLGAAQAAVDAEAAAWRAKGNVRRLWHGDATLWSGADEGQWLGWLHVVAGQREHGEHFAQVVETARSGAFKHVLLLGMGGSSLCPEVMRKTFGIVPGFPELLVLDSTVPAQVRAFANKIDPAKTLFIVASKSGGTIEPNVFKQYFFERVKEAVGADKVGSHFVAITDPGTKMHQVAKGDRFRHIFFGLPSIGGRFSGLSNFGMVPAAAMGVDVKAFLDSAEVMVESCAACVPPEVNPGVSLGLILGTLQKQGRDKVTILASPAIGSLGAWLEQLIAESTGKSDTGLVPIADEKLGPPSAYGADRVFCYVRLATKPCSDQDAAVDALEKAGHPVVRMSLGEPIDLGQEFFRWEVATAAAGAVIGINAFNQPDVEAAKVAARKLTSAYEETGKLPPETPILESDGLKLFADARNAADLASTAKAKTAAGYVAAHLARLKPGDYFAINAYVEMNEANEAELQGLRHAVRDARRVATTLGFGPRFLHSTGQLHKGGPNSGVFLQVTCDDAQDLPIPGQKFTFGVLKQAQAQGDFEVLAGRGRRILRVHLGADVKAGLGQLKEMVLAGLR